MGSVMFTLSDVFYCIFIITLQNSVGKIRIFDIKKLMKNLYHQACRNIEFNSVKIIIVIINEKYE